MEKKLVYYKNLDGIRGIAAISVLIFHFFLSQNVNYLTNLKFYQKITEVGQHGVSLFFVLSGFVITRILLNAKGDNNFFFNFYKRRSLRIFPLYYLYLIIIYYVIPFISSKEIIDFKLQLPFYLYLQNLTEFLKIKASGPGHFWTLAIEEHFYLFWPLVLYYVPIKKLKGVIFFLILSIFFLKYYLLKNNFSINYFTLTRIDQIMMGGYLAILELKSFFESRNSIKKMISILVFILPIGLFTYLLNNSFPFLKEMMKYPILGLFFFAILGILLTLNKDNFINKFLTNSILQYLGKISYGIYVWHMLAIFILGEFLITKMIIIDLLLTCLLTIALAHLSYFYYELYFIRLKDKI